MSTLKCPAPCCSKSFPQIDEALKHVVSHTINDRGCVVPGCRRQNPRHLWRHTSKSHKPLCQHQCSSCTRVFVLSAHMSQHFRDKHGGGTQFPSLTATPYVNVHSSTVTSPLEGLHWYPSNRTNANIISHFARMNLENNSEGTSSIDSSPASARFDLNSPTSEDDLNRFIVDQLQPNQSFNAQMGEIVDRICSLFQINMQPMEIIKGGSMGKGTAIRGNADIDMILILKEDVVSNASELQDELEKIQKLLKHYLDHGPNRDFTVKPDSIKTTRFAVQFTVQRGTEEIKVDLLPTFHFTDKQVLYRQMENDPGSLLPYYSASLAKLQVNFVSPMPANVKNLIRLVKYWNKEHVVGRTPQSRIPTSYVLELITINLWEEKGRPNRFDTLKAFHSVMKALSNNQSICAIWSDNYKRHEIPESILLQRPLVMDPANPFNNVCHSFSWEEIQQKAEEALTSPMLRCISSTTW